MAAIRLGKVLLVKTVSYDGVAAATADAVADAVLELTMAVARHSRYESVTFPVLVAGRTEQLTLVLGPTIHLSLLTESTYTDGATVEGAEEASDRIRLRATAITDPPFSFEDDDETALFVNDGD